MVEPIGDLIKQIREAAGDSPAQAADKVGISRQGYNKWEGGDTENMKLRHLVTFCDRYRVNIESLVRGKVDYLDQAQPKNEAGKQATEGQFTQERSTTVLPTKERHPLYFKLDGYTNGQLDKVMALLRAAEDLDRPASTDSTGALRPSDTTWTKLGSKNQQKSTGREAEK